jgi:hypothetical protein
VFDKKARLISLPNPAPLQYGHSTGNLVVNNVCSIFPLKNQTPSNKIIRFISLAWYSTMTKIFAIFQKGGRKHDALHKNKIKQNNRLTFINI